MKIRVTMTDPEVRLKKLRKKFFELSYQVDKLDEERGLLSKAIAQLEGQIEFGRRAGFATKLGE